MIHVGYTDLGAGTGGERHRGGGGGETGAAARNAAGRVRIDVGGRRDGREVLAVGVDAGVNCLRDGGTG